MTTRQDGHRGPRVIAGSGRSGTTWVLDTVAMANGLRTVFEPLFPACSETAQRFANRYLPADAEEPELERYLSRMLDGRLRSLWTDLRMAPGYLTHWRAPKAMLVDWARVLRRSVEFGRKRRQPVLTKFIRANLMLPWLARTCDARIALVVRHPAGVISSKLRLGGPNWHHARPLERYLQDSMLVDRHLGSLRDTLSGPLSPVAAHAAIWCIENAVPMAEATRSGFRVVHYESLLARDPGAWSELLEALGLAGRPDEALLERPSQMASPATRGQRYTGDHVDRWRKQLGDAELTEIDRMLDAFGVDAYRAEEALPKLAPVPAAK